MRFYGRQEPKQTKSYLLLGLPRDARQYLVDLDLVIHHLTNLQANINCLQEPQEKKPFLLSVGQATIRWLDEASSMARDWRSIHPTWHPLYTAFNIAHMLRERKSAICPSIL